MATVAKRETKLLRRKNERIDHLDGESPLLASGGRHSSRLSSARNRLE